MIDISNKKVLCLPDLHLIGKNSRLFINNNEAKVINSLESLIVNYDYVFFMGDMVENHHTTALEFSKTDIGMKLISILKSYPQIKFHLIIGNHEPKDIKLIFSDYFTEINDGFSLILNGIKIRLEHGHLLMYKYKLSRSNFQKNEFSKYDKLRNDFEYFVFGLSSIFTKGKTLPGKIWNQKIADIITRDKLYDDVVIFGHTHYTQQFLSNRCQIYFTGNAAYGHIPYIEIINGKINTKNIRY